MNTSNTSPVSSGFAFPLNESNPQAEKFKNTLDFLEEIKLQFTHEPRVYMQFLDILRDFKAQR